MQVLSQSSLSSSSGGVGLHRWPHPFFNLGAIDATPSHQREQHQPSVRNTQPARNAKWRESGLIGRLWLLVGHWFLFFFVYLVRRFNVLSSRSQTFQWYSHLQRSLWTVWCSDWAVADWAVEWTKHLVLLMMTIATQAKKESCWKMRSKSSRLIPSCTRHRRKGRRGFLGQLGWFKTLWNHILALYLFFVGHAMDFSIFPARSLICYVVVTRIKTLAFFRPGLVRWSKLTKIDYIFDIKDKPLVYLQIHATVFNSCVPAWIGLGLRFFLGGRTGTSVRLTGLEILVSQGFLFSILFPYWIDRHVCSLHTACFWDKTMLSTGKPFTHWRTWSYH